MDALAYDLKRFKQSTVFLFNNEAEGMCDEPIKPLGGTLEHAILKCSGGINTSLNGHLAKRLSLVCPSLIYFPSNLTDLSHLSGREPWLRFLRKAAPHRGNVVVVVRNSFFEFKSWLTLKYR